MKLGPSEDLEIDNFSTNISFMVTFLIEQKGITFDHFTFLLLHSSFLLPSFSRWEEGKRITKVVVKSHAFFLVEVLNRLDNNKKDMFLKQNSTF